MTTGKGVNLWESIARETLEFFPNQKGFRQEKTTSLSFPQFRNEREV